MAYLYSPESPLMMIEPSNKESLDGQMSVDIPG